MIHGLEIKVCGLKYAGNAMEVAMLRPDYMGFIFFPGSPRFIPPESEDFIAGLPEGIRKTGVFVDQSPDEILSKTKHCKLDFVQLHGQESPELCLKIKEYGAGVIKAFGVAAEKDLVAVRPYHKVCDYFLFDTRTKGFGGSGTKFNWKILEEQGVDKPFFIGGGIGLDDADHFTRCIIKNLRGVDINSRFEIKPGLKDTEKVGLFMEKIRRKHVL